MASSVPSGDWPARYLPVTVGADLTLIRQSGLLAFAGPICAYPVGFLFYLTISANSRALDPRLQQGPPEDLVNFWTMDESQPAARIQVGFSDGRTAESGDDTAGQATASGIVLNYSGGFPSLRSNAPVLTAESCWWVSPLPPDGPVHFAITLPEFPGGTHSAAVGRAELDASLITAAASKSSPLWPGAESDSP